MKESKTPMVEYFELLKKRRAVRDFEDRDVPPEVLQEIIQESCLAPSSMNRQSWRFIIIMDRSMIRRLSDESKMNTLEQILEEPDAPRRELISSLRDEGFKVLCFGGDPAQWGGAAGIFNYEPLSINYEQ